MLSEYITRTQLFLGVDSTSTLYPTTNLVTFINMARQRIAAQGQCVRILLPPYGRVGNLVVTSSDTYVSPPTVSISAPDMVTSQPGVPATASVVMAGNVVSYLSITNPGSGYFAPTVTFNSGRSAAYAVPTALCATSGMQQIYTFAQFSTLVRAQAGVSSILAIQGISFLWGNLRYSRAAVSFSKFQALINNYNALYDVPSVVANYGQGENGSFYVWPIPNMAYGMEIDCICTPQNLIDDSSPEAIPAQWTDAVPYYATHLALLGAQRFDDGDSWEKRFNARMKQIRAYSQPGASANPYGRAL